MKIKREQLRQSAQVALAEQGYSDIELVRGRGIVPGARLSATKDGTSLKIAVRTSSDREVALLRTATGKWRTISRVDLVVVAVPADETPTIDVLAFDPKILLETFDARAQAKEKGNRHDDRYKSPFFIALDDIKDSKTKQVHPGLKEKAVWRAQVALDQLPAAASLHEDRAHFFERMKREIADFIGIDVSKIELDIRIKS